jgi:HNH endonuclease
MLDQKTVRELLDYDPQTGKLTWRLRARKWFKTDGAYKAFNTQFAGKEAFAARDAKGYMRGDIFSRRYGAHRVIWLLMTGAWPVDQLDHINKDPSDNRFANLRESTNAENRRNITRPSNNTTGFVGVVVRGEKYIAQIKVNERLFHLGLFPTIEAAAAARYAAQQKYGFSPGHGTPRAVPIGNKKQWSTPRVWEVPLQRSLYGQIYPQYPTPLEHIRPLRIAA